MAQTKLIEIDKKKMSQFDWFSSGDYREDIYYWKRMIIFPISVNLIIWFHRPRPVSKLKVSFMHSRLSFPSA